MPKEAKNSTQIYTACAAIAKKPTQNLRKSPYLPLSQKNFLKIFQLVRPRTAPLSQNYYAIAKRLFIKIKTFFLFSLFIFFSESMCPVRIACAIRNRNSAISEQTKFVISKTGNVPLACYKIW